MKLQPLKLVSLLGILTTGLGFGLNVSAAAYEWIPNLQGYQFEDGNSHCPTYHIECWFKSWDTTANRLQTGPDRSTRFEWSVSTTQAFVENRSLYYAITSPTFVPSRNWNGWTEVAGCRRSGSIPNGTTDNCYVSSTVAAVGSTLWYRVVTQRSGCGTLWDPTPTPHCGAFNQASSTVY